MSNITAVLQLFQLRSCIDSELSVGVCCVLVYSEFTILVNHTVSSFPSLPQKATLLLQGTTFYRPHFSNGWLFFLTKYALEGLIFVGIKFHWDFVVRHKFKVELRLSIRSCKSLHIVSRFYTRNILILRSLTKYWWKNFQISHENYSWNLSLSKFLPPKISTAQNIYRPKYLPHKVSTGRSFYLPNILPAKVCYIKT